MTWTAQLFSRRYTRSRRHCSRAALSRVQSSRVEDRPARRGNIQVRSLGGLAPRAPPSPRQRVADEGWRPQHGPRDLSRCAGLLEWIMSVHGPPAEPLAAPAPPCRTSQSPLGLATSRTTSHPRWPQMSSTDCAKSSRCGRRKLIAQYIRSSVHELTLALFLPPGVAQVHASRKTDALEGRGR